MYLFIYLFFNFPILLSDKNSEIENTRTGFHIRIPQFGYYSDIIKRRHKTYTNAGFKLTAYVFY
jgi:hypothetical protein